MITIKEIAKEAGVSIGTVDRVLHNRGRVSREAQEKVNAVVEKAGYKPNTVAQGLAVRKKGLKICFMVPETTYNPFFKDVEEAAVRKAKELEAYGVRVEFLKLRTNREAKAVQDNIKGIEKIIKDADGLATIGLEAKEILYCVEAMEKQKKPVVFYNSILNGRKYLAYVGCDYEKSGRLAAGLCALAGGKNARVCMFSEGLKEAASSFERIVGFRKEAEAHYPQMKIEGCWQILDDPVENNIQVEKMLAEYPDVNVVYIANPADYKICELIHRADTNHQLKIVTNDVVETFAQMMEDGVVDATISQQPKVQGALSLEILFRYLAFGEKPKEKNCYTELHIHILQNLYQN